MSHVFIVQSSRGDSANRIFADGLQVFSDLFKLRPSDSLASEALAVAVFPRDKGRSAAIFRSETASRWLCGSGTWFYEGASGQEGLRKLSEHPHFPTNGSCTSLHNLDGQFALASGDSRSGELVVITDRLGILHVYVATIGNSQVLSTSSIVLAALAGAAWDPEGVRQFLGSANLYEPARTLFKDVKKLEDARAYYFANGCLKSQLKYWSIESVLRENPDKQVDVQSVSAALQDSLHTVSRNFPKPLLDFTGGFDTRGLVGAMLRANLNLDLVVNGPSDSPDLVASTRVATELGLRHHHRYRGFRSAQEWWDRSKQSLTYCDGECDVLRYGATLDAHLLNSDGFDASVNGAIGEVLKGHWWELLFPYTGRRHHFDCHLVASRRLTHEGEVPGLLAFTYSTNLTNYYADVIRQAVSGLEDFPNTVQMDAVYLILRQQKWLGRTMSATDRIWPCISPYGFRQPLELAILASTSAKLHHRMSRRLVEYEDRRLARLPLPGGYPAAPLRPTTLHLFWPVLLHYSRLVSRRLLIQAKLRPAGRNVRMLYPTVGLPVTQLFELEEVRALLDPGQMYTRELYDGRILHGAVSKRASDTSVSGYRLGRILTLELLARSVRRATESLRTQTV